MRKHRQLKPEVRLRLLRSRRHSTSSKSHTRQFTMLEIIWEDAPVTPEPKGSLVCSSVDGEAVEGQSLICRSECPRCSAKVPPLAESQKTRELTQCPWCGYIFRACF